MAKDIICSIDECNNPAITRGWCCAHYNRWKRNGDPRGVRTPNGAPISFIHQTLVTTSADCIFWPYSKNNMGYGVFNVGGAARLVHRYICELVNGPSDLEATHECGRGHLGCINPNHLTWKTHKDNHADREDHGTLGRGPENSQAKLTDADVLAIVADHRIYKLIAADFGVTESCIKAIKRGGSWSHLTGISVQKR